MTEDRSPKYGLTTSTTKPVWLACWDLSRATLTLETHHDDEKRAFDEALAALRESSADLPVGREAVRLRADEKRLQEIAAKLRNARDALVAELVGMRIAIEDVVQEERALRPSGGPLLPIGPTQPGVRHARQVGRYSLRSRRCRSSTTLSGGVGRSATARRRQHSGRAISSPRSSNTRNPRRVGCATLRRRPATTSAPSFTRPTAGSAPSPIGAYIWAAGPPPPVDEGPLLGRLLSSAWWPRTPSLHAHRRPITWRRWRRGLTRRRRGPRRGAGRRARGARRRLPGAAGLTRGRSTSS